MLRDSSTFSEIVKESLAALARRRRVPLEVPKPGPQTPCLLFFRAQIFQLHAHEAAGRVLEIVPERVKPPKN